MQGLDLTVLQLIQASTASSRPWFYGTYSSLHLENIIFFSTVSQPFSTERDFTWVYQYKKC